MQSIEERRKEKRRFLESKEEFVQREEIPDGAIKVNYGPLKKGMVYNIISEGIDFYVVKLKGKRLYVPKDMF